MASDKEKHDLVKLFYAIDREVYALERLRSGNNPSLDGAETAHTLGDTYATLYHVADIAFPGRKAEWVRNRS